MSSTASRSSVFAWLVCEGRPPVPLGPKSQVTIGRSGDCDLVLNDAQVSRLQGTIKVDAACESAIYRDCDSSNGSFLNGEEVSESPVRPGDVLTLGPFEVRVQPVVAWLCSGLMAPIPLGVARTLRIGRSKDCDVVIRDPGVSRHQASIEVEGGQLFFVDAGSSNGSFVNGRRVEGRRPLAVGDALHFGPYELVLRSSEDLRAQEELEQELTRPLSPGLSTGLLSELSVAQLLQQLHLDARTGSLRLVSGPQQGLVVFESGRPVYARFGILRDEAALLSLLELEDGRYTFLADVDDSEGERTLEAEVPAILIRHAARRDEDRRDEARGRGGDEVATVRTPRPGPPPGGGA